MGLIRKTIVLGAILFALPSPPDTETVAGEPSLQASTIATLSAASETVADAKGFCERRVQACATGAFLWSKIEAKARYSAKLAYEWASPKPVVVVTDIAPSKAKAGAPPLRLATINDTKPAKINDLLRGPAE